MGAPATTVPMLGRGLDTLGGLGAWRSRDSRSVEAFRGLRGGDAHLRGTALESLEGILPQELRVAQWPVLEERSGD
jgi:hypothetical protein